MPERAHTSKASDEALMEQFKGGKETAFVELYKRYNRRVYAYCMKMVGKRELAEDLFQEIFVRVARKREQFKEGSFAAWIFAIARNLCLNALRDRVEHIPIDDVHDSMLTSPEVATFDFSTEILKKAIDQLPTDLREAITLRVYQGLSYNEIAEITGAKLATVKVRIFRAKQRLHETLAPYFVDDV